MRATTSSLGITAIFFLVSMAADAQQLQRLERPLVPLMTLTGQMFVPQSDEQLRQLANTYRLVNAHGGLAGELTEPAEFGRRLRAVNPDFLLSHYLNGSYVGQGQTQEAPEVERLFPLGIAVWRPDCRLKSGVSAEQTSLEILPPSQLPSAAPPIYPLKASTTSEQYSRTKNQYVAWLRMNQEILRIDRAEAVDGAIRLTVRRGTWNTTAAQHGPDSAVLLPIYIGSVRQGADVSLGGVPDSKSGLVGLRYALQVQDPGFQQWLGDKCERIFRMGFDVAWLDVTSSSWYNNADAYGNAITPWDIAKARPLDNAAYLEYQQQKIDYLFKRFPDRRFFVNNVKPWMYTGAAGERRMMTGEPGHHPVSGGSIENYANVRDESAWRETVETTLDFVKSGFTGVAWSKAQGQQNSPRYRLFAYATFLMAWQPEAKLMFGGGWGPGRRPDEFHCWDLAAPSEHFAKVDDAQRPDAPGVYQRKFRKGLVLVNTRNRNAASIRLEGRWLAPETQTAVDTIELPAMSAKLLLKQ